MKVRVTEEGVLVPRDMLAGVDEVEIRKEGRDIIVTPTQADIDPIYRLGKNPVDVGVTNGAARHDHYLYGRD